MAPEAEPPGPGPGTRARWRARWLTQSHLIAAVAGAIVVTVGLLVVVGGRSSRQSSSPPTPTTATLGGTRPTSPGSLPPGSAGATGNHVTVCGNAALLTGPATAPAGAVRVDPGRDLQAATQAAAAGSTFWLAPGTHTLGADQFDQVVPKDGDVYVGAPGAVLDGRRINRYAFTQHARNVIVRYLTITGFGAVGTNGNEGVVNHDSGSGWTVEFDTITGNAGAGVMIGDDDVIRSNCLAGNGEYGFSAFSPAGVHNVMVVDNEVAGNNTDDWESRVAGCGCTGGGKFWDTTVAVVTGNWVHDNHGVGLFADTDNVGFRIEENTIEGNDAEGIVYEISYNARIAHNTLARNALVKGRQFAARGDNFPIAAIYLSESGGDPRLDGGTYADLEVVANRLVDNWGGVVLWENADRFCGSPANSSTSYCSEGGVASLANCTAAKIGQAPFLSDCRWKTQNVSVAANTFELDRPAIGCAPADPCGQQAILANYGTFPAWSPYKARAVQDAIVYHQNNHFRDNTYRGDWHFTAYETGNSKTLSEWQATYHQDQGSHTG